MIIKADIDIDNLFRQVQDNTIFDSRSLMGAVDDRMAMSAADRDIFGRQLKEIADTAYLEWSGHITDYYMNEKQLTLKMRCPDGVKPDTLASRMKDILKHGMLEWWFSTRNQQLALVYSGRMEELKDSLRSVLLGEKISERPYRYF